MAIRIFTDILIAISIFFLTPWAPLVLVIGAIFYFKNFYEAIAAGVLIDMLYGVSLVKFFHTQCAMTLLFFLYILFLTTQSDTHDFMGPVRDKPVTNGWI